MALTFFSLLLQRAKMSDFDRYKVMKAKRMVSTTEVQIYAKPTKQLKCGPACIVET